MHACAFCQVSRLLENLDALQYLLNVLALCVCPGDQSPAQEWGDDTHPEIGRSVLQQLAARGVRVHKAMATRTPPTMLIPPLPGWPVAGTPGCLLMAIVSAATNRDWNGAGTRLGSGKDAAEDAYWRFAAATKALGFGAMLTTHR